MEGPLLGAPWINSHAFSTKCIDKIFAVTNSFFRVTTEHKPEMFTIDLTIKDFFRT